VEPISPELVLVDPLLAHAVRQRSTTAPFRVAFICTGNRFRSALAEAAFRAATSGLPVEARSYGIINLGSAHPLPRAIRVAESFGLDISRHVARPLAGADLSQSSLVVGFTSHHVESAVELGGAKAERAFLFLELVDLFDAIGECFASDPIERAATTVARANAYRGAAVASRSRREIPDPVDLPEAAQSEIGRLVCEGVAKLTHGLFGRLAHLPARP
jgi:protein-tyrosine-phosphatase